MQEQRADALPLAVGKPDSLMQNGTVRPITREPLTDSQIQGLLRAIASAEAAPQLGLAESLSFVYRSPSGEVRVEHKSGANGAAILRSVAAPAPSSPPPPPSSPSYPSSAPSSRPAPSSSPAARSPQDTDELRRAMDALFRLMVSAGASDLHL